MKLIVGLNNPEERFNNTRHNAGAMVLDHKLKNEVEAEKFRGRVIGPIMYEGIETLFLKPSTYMNDSGKSVKEAVETYKIELKDVLIISDDVALPFGKIRMRAAGSSGRHKGLDSIFECLMTSNVPRLKIGVGLKPAEYTLRDWVLGKFSDEELRDWPVICDAAWNAISIWAKHGIEQAMSDANCFDLRKYLAQKESENTALEI